MSRAYRIQIAHTERRHVVVDDAVCTDLDLLPLVSPARLAELLAAELERRGFTAEDGVARRELEDGVVVEVAVDTARVTVRATGEQQLEHTIHRRSNDEADGVRQRLEKEAVAEANERLDRAAEQIQRQATRALEAALRDVRGELDEIGHAVTAQALKEKAASLGEILEQSEDPETGELTIKVKV